MERGIVLRSHPALRHGKELFVRNTAASMVTFGFDIVLLWLLVELAGVPRVLAALIAFLAAITLHYVLSRIWVFTDTDQGIATGYVYFLVNAGVGLVLTIGLFWLLIALTPINYLLARALVSVVAGLVVFVLNAVYNFKALKLAELAPRHRPRHGRTGMS
jgi:putative flippase GtrA